MKYSKSTLNFNAKTPSKILNELLRKKLKLSNVELKEDNLVVTVANSDYYKCKQVADLFNCEVCVIGNSGVLGAFCWIKLHVGLIIGMMIFMAVILILSQFVLKIEVKCDKPQFNGEIEQLLKRNGFTYGKAINSVDTDEVELLVTENIEEVSFVTAFIEGVSLKLEVVTVHIPLIPDENREQIVSMYDAIVTRVMVTSGTALVKPEQRVLKGEQLIGDYVVIDNDKYDDILDGEKVKVAPKGEVYGKVYYHKRIVIPAIAYTTVRTGNKQTVRNMYISDNKIGKEKACKYERYEAVTTYAIINVLIPIKVKTTVYYEIKDIEISREVYKESMINKTREEMLNSLPRNANVLNSWIIQKEGCNLDTFDVYLEAEQRLDI